MAESGSGLEAGLLVVAAAGTRQALPSLGNVGAGKTVTVQAALTNEGTIVVGDNGVVAKAGTHAKPERVGVALNPGDTFSLDIVDTAQIYVDATVNGDAIGYVALLA